MPENAAHEARITTLEKQQESITGSLKSLADDMRKIADAVIRQEEDRAALRRAFGQIEKLSTRFDGLENRIGQIETDTLKDTIESQKTELDEVKRTRNQITLEIVKALVLFATGAAAMHFGVRLMG